MPRNISRMARMEIMRRGRSNDAESRFRDRRGREHYDNGRFAPMNDTNIEIEGRFRDNSPWQEYQGGRSGTMMRGNSSGGNYSNRGNMQMNNGNSGAQNYYPGRPFPVYREAGMRGGGYEMNQIGFNANREMESNFPMDAGYRGEGGMRNNYQMNAGYDGEQDMQNNYRMDSGYQGGSTMDHQTSERMSGHGMGMESGGRMTKDVAEKWVHSMKGADGTKGQYWTMDQAKQIMARYGFQGDPIEWYVVLNMMKRDYSKAAAKIGVDKEEFYACMTNAFLNDEDAEPDKLMRYYQAVVKK